MKVGNAMCKRAYLVELVAEINRVEVILDIRIAYASASIGSGFAGIRLHVFEHRGSSTSTARIELRFILGVDFV